MKTALWSPTKQQKQATRLQAYEDFLSQTKGLSFKNYEALHRWSCENLEDFWESIWDFFHVHGEKGKKPYLINKESCEKARFFPNARLNFAENILKHRAEKDALMTFNEKGEVTTYSQKELYEAVCKCALFLKSMNIKSKDRIASVLPCGFDGVVLQLATVAVGAIWTGISPDFGVQGLEDRLGQVNLSLIVATTSYTYQGKNYDCQEKILTVCKDLKEPVLWLEPAQHGAPTTLETLIKEFNPSDFIFEQFDFDHPLYILYSSGTTGVPKCIIHGAGGTLLQHLKELQLQSDVHSKDKIFYFTTTSWMMWHWLVSALASGACVATYDGSPSYLSPGFLLHLAKKHDFTHFGTSAKYIDSLKKQNISFKEGDFPNLRMIISTGSPLCEDSYHYIYEHIKKDVCLSSVSGGSDIISCFAIGNPKGDVYPGELQVLGLGYDVRVFDESAKELKKGEKGELVCVKPFVSRPIGFYGDDENNTKYHKAYYARFNNIWHHGDYCERTTEGGLVIYGRSDATLNPGGVRIGTAEIYRQVEIFPEIQEALAVGRKIEDDEEVILFVKMAPNLALNEELIKRLKSHIRLSTTPRHVPAHIYETPDIPKTKNNKIAELAVKQIIHGQEVKNKEALLNPESLDDFKAYAVCILMLL